MTVWQNVRDHAGLHSGGGDRGLAEAHSSTEGLEGILTSFSTSSQPTKWKIITFPPFVAPFLKHTGGFMSSGCSRVGTFCLGKTSLLGEHSERAALSGLEQTEPQVDAVTVQVLSGAFGGKLDQRKSARNLQLLILGEAGKGLDKTG